VTNTLYSAEPSLCSALPLPLLHNVWRPSGDNVSTPPVNDTVLPQPSQLQYAQTPGLLLHSPVPVSGASWPIISPESSALRDNSYNQGTNSGAKHPPLNDEPDLLRVYASVPRETFPTPSELLNKATSKQKSVSASAKPGRKTEKKVETQRKALQRVLQESIGFSPTDPFVLPGCLLFAAVHLLFTGIQYLLMIKSVIIWSASSNTSRIYTSSSAWLGTSLYRSSAYQPIAGSQAVQSGYLPLLSRL
jgi:hypothetical protein